MKCPVCKETALVMSERQSIEIDYCPNCRGVWLDRGELDKLIEKSVEQNRSSGSQSIPPAPSASQQHHQSYQHNPYHKKKRESWLSDLFD
jgi:Zn-finger nucleic acid-binding protein